MLLTVFVLILVLIGIVLVAVLLVILGAVAVLVIHDLLPSSLIFAVFRYISIRRISGFILCLKKETGY